MEEDYMQKSIDTSRFLRSYSRDFFTPAVEDVEFWLYTRIEPKYDLFVGDWEGNANSTFNPDVYTTVLTHGFLENALNEDWMHQMKDTLLKKDDCNVILVQWYNLSSRINYGMAASNSFFTGQQIAGLIHTLQGVFPTMNTNMFHLIGFSLGAHAMGEAGRIIPGIGRITGLDPAGPGFEYAHSDDRLDWYDAEFVDIIHTNGGLLINGCFGISEPIGDVDFFVNGGQHQKGCPNFYVASIFNLLTLDPQLIGSCSHSRAPYLYLETITLPVTFGFNCSDYNKYQEGDCFGNEFNAFGYQTRITESQTYYISTQSEAPFISTQMEILIIIGGQRNHTGKIMITPFLHTDQQEQIAFFGDTEEIVANDTVKELIAIPVGTSIEELEIEIEFKTEVMAFFYPDGIMISVVELQNIVTNQSFCYIFNRVLKYNEPVRLYPNTTSCLSLHTELNEI